MQVNAWSLFFFPIFRDAFDRLTDEVFALAEKDPEGYKAHPKTKLLAKVYAAVFEWVPSDPNSPVFLLGGTLGRDYKMWRRVKNGLPSRYRLFFRFSKEKMSIVYVWLNDEFSLRKEGAKTDVYSVFISLLNQSVPSDFNELLVQSAPPQSP
jgi:toxin YhaV